MATQGPEITETTITVSKIEEKSKTIAPVITWEQKFNEAMSEFNSDDLLLLKNSLQTDIQKQIDAKEKGMLGFFRYPINPEAKESIYHEAYEGLGEKLEELKEKAEVAKRRAEETLLAIVKCETLLKAASTSDSNDQNTALNVSSSSITTAYSAEVGSKRAASDSPTEGEERAVRPKKAAVAKPGKL